MCGFSTPAADMNVKIVNVIEIILEEGTLSLSTPAYFKIKWEKEGKHEKWHEAEAIFYESEREKGSRAEVPLCEAMMNVFARESVGIEKF